MSDTATRIAREVEQLCEAAELVVRAQVASLTFLQRKLNVACLTAARLLTALESVGAIDDVDPETAPRVLAEPHYLNEVLERCVEYVTKLNTDAELDAAADALGWPANEQGRAHALIALTAAARVRREERVTPEEEVHDEMCPGCSTCLHPDAAPSGGAR